MIVSRGFQTLSSSDKPFPELPNPLLFITVFDMTTRSTFLPDLNSITITQRQDINDSYSQNNSKTVGKNDVQTFITNKY